jgi:hypothetical protein
VIDPKSVAPRVQIAFSVKLGRLSEFFSMQAASSSSSPLWSPKWRALLPLTATIRRELRKTNVAAIPAGASALRR